MVEFSREAGPTKPNYAAFDESKLVSRCGSRHKELGYSSLEFQTLDSLNNFEKEHGLRFSELFALEYFDPVKMHVIDPMHALLLGVAKRVFLIWVDLGILTPEKFEMIDENQKKLKVPTDKGRLACSMSAYKRMKADEWKH